MPDMSPAQLAKQALRRIAVSKLEPTPDNYARAYAAEAAEAGQALPENSTLPERAVPALQRMLLWVGDPTERQALTQTLRQSNWDELQRQVERLLAADGPSAQGEAWCQTVERLVRGLERGGKVWTLARKKDGLQRVLNANKGDSARLVRRLRQLVQSWDSDTGSETGVDMRSDDAEGTPSQFLEEMERDEAPPVREEISEADRIALAPMDLDDNGGDASLWHTAGSALHTTVQTALAPIDPTLAPEAHIQELSQALEAAHAALQANPGDAAQSEAIQALCERARRTLGHRQQLLHQLGGLCHELSGSLVELSEDESWAQGQAHVMADALAQGLTPRAVRSVSDRLAATRERQRGLRAERTQARDALKGLIHTLLQEIGQLSQHTGRFSQNMGRYVEVIEQADTLESLTGVVREMVQESRSVHDLVQQTQTRLHQENERTQALSDKVQALERELQRLANEVQTDQLTRVANRRGLIAAFDGAQSQQARDGQPLSLALLDIDNFKKLNDSLGHAAGDEALKNLAARAQAIVRPGDLVARYGGEEFVLVLPATPLDEAAQVLGRLQRSLSASLFMHEGKDVFVTFSAGATLYRPGESLEQALDRADEALYEAKRSGKNRTCLAH
jgi:diguanylate cyclase